jgi:hypothetical protein
MRERYPSPGLCELRPALGLSAASRDSSAGQGLGTATSRVLDTNVLLPLTTVVWAFLMTAFDICSVEEESSFVVPKKRHAEG